MFKIVSKHIGFVMSMLHAKSYFIVLFAMDDMVYFVAKCICSGMWLLEELLCLGKVGCWYIAITN